MDVPLAQPPPISVLNVVFGKQHPVPKWCKKICSTRACSTTATVCVKRKSNIGRAKFGNLGDDGVKGSKFVVENVIFEIADPDLPIHYATFMGLR